MRTILRRTTIAVISFAALAAVAFFTLTGRLPAVDAGDIDLSSHPSFRTWSEHNEIYQRVEFPYIVEIDGANGALLYIGVQHSTDPDDKQWDSLRAAWQQFEPTIALNEGRTRYFRWESLAVGGISDPKLAFILARQDGIPIYSLEPTYQTEVNALLENWPAELVATYFSLRVITSEAGGDADRAAAIADGLIGKRTDVDGLRSTLADSIALDSVWSQHFADQPDWRSLSNADAVPLLRKIGDDSRIVRGQHMVRAIATLVANGERVVAVVGSSHVIRHEPLIRSLLASTAVTVE